MEEYNGAHFYTLILPKKKIDIFPGEGVPLPSLSVGEWIVLEGHKERYCINYIGHKMIRITDSIFRPIVSEIHCDSY